MPGGGHPPPALPLPQEGLGSQFLTLSARALQGLLLQPCPPQPCGCWPERRVPRAHGCCVLLRGTPVPSCSSLRWPCHSPQPGPGVERLRWGWVRGWAWGLIQPHGGEHRDGTRGLPACLAQLREAQHNDDSRHTFITTALEFLGATANPRLVPLCSKGSGLARCGRWKDGHGHGDGGLCSSATTARWWHGAPAAPLAVTLTCADSSKPGCGNLGCATEESHGQEGRGRLLPPPRCCGGHVEWWQRSRGASRPGCTQEGSLLQWLLLGEARPALPSIATGWSTIPSTALILTLVLAVNLSDVWSGLKDKMFIICHVTTWLFSNVRKGQIALVIQRDPKP